jgi:hypothetical protein
MEEAIWQLGNVLMRFGGNLGMRQKGYLLIC